MRVGLSVYGTVFSMGIHPQSGRTPISPRQLMDRALATGLTGVEMPVSLMQGQDVTAVARYAQEHGLFITLAAGGYQPGPQDQLAQAIDLSARLGARTVRTTIGGAKIGGDRRHLVGRWQPFLQEVLAALREATAMAEQKGINLAVENHQDLASEELLWLCETIGSPHFGITLDTGNPLATVEEPLDFARKVAPHLKNVHLKDYMIFLSEEGYRLVRCPLGQGVIDFPALFTLLAEVCPDVPLSIELGALEARHIRALADDYWPEYPSRSAAQFAHVWHFVQANARPMGDWRTPFERAESVQAISAYEEQQLAASLAYLTVIQAPERERF